ncbi:MAG: hypothetical protein KAT11_05935 [Phycisphaerae bacterium]|nr:hypothetical protein [Phycisphaerae bacterium]
MNSKIVKLVMCALLAVVGLGVPAGGAQTKPKVSGPIECERTVKKDSNSSGAETAEKTCEKNIREGVDPKILEVLDKLEKLGQTVKDLQAELSLEKLETLVDDRSTKEGKLYYQQEKKKIRFRISFEKTRYDGRTRADREDFVFADGWLTHRQARGKREDRYQYTRPGQQSKDLMRIGKSPLPILIGQKAEEVLKKFEVSLIEANEKTDPAKIKTVHLKLLPRKGTELAMSHTRLEFWLEEPRCLPLRSQWENDSGDIFTADMSKLRVNKKMNKKVFKLPKLPAGYETKDHPLPEEEEE